MATGMAYRARHHVGRRLLSINSAALERPKSALFRYVAGTFCSETMAENTHIGVERNITG